MQLSVVYGREINGEVTSFGTTGYTYKNTFLLYDRKTDSVWYPYKSDEMNAISGKSSGSAIPFLAEPKPMPLAKWREQHPDSLVLVGDEPREGKKPKVKDKRSDNRATSVEAEKLPQP